MTSIGPYDVLCGRGGATNNNAGNVRFRDIVASKQLVYLDAKKKEKRLIALDCVNEVKSLGGRFLKKDDKTGSWIEVPKAKTVTKASQALRENLDVRHKKFRDDKVTRGNSDSASKKRAKVATGKVASSPALVSLQGVDRNIPELSEEVPPAPAQVPFNFQPPEISKGDCEQISEVWVNVPLILFVLNENIIGGRGKLVLVLCTKYEIITQMDDNQAGLLISDVVVSEHIYSRYAAHKGELIKICLHSSLAKNVKYKGNGR
mgnify:CR=1 FL=1